MTLQRNLIQLVLASLLPAALASLLLIAYSYERHRESVQENTLATARALMQAVDRDLASNRTALQELATSPYLAADDLAAFHTQAREVLAELPGNNIVLTNPAGQQVLNTFRPLGEALPPAGSPNVQRVFQTGEPFVSDLFYGEVARRQLIAIHVPVRRDGRVVYGMAMGVFPDRLAKC